MADTRTMVELLQAPIEGYGDAIVIPAILAENFELKVGLLQLVTSSQFYGFERDDPHAHIQLHQIDTFYNALTQSDQDSLNAAAGGNLLNRTPCTTTSSQSPLPDFTTLTEMVKELVLMNKANPQASVKAVEEICVTCGEPHPYYECLATDSNTFNAYAAT
ncbi:hypothetical protein Tco_1316296 [Tanacetum coccineum]